MRKMRDISKLCLRKVLKCGTKRPLPLFVKAISVEHRHEASLQAELCALI